MKKKFLIGLITLLCSCSYSTYYLQSGVKAPAATNVSDIKFYSGKPDKSFTVIASIAVDGVNKDAAKTLLREKAAAIGADAVIYVDLDNISTSSKRIGMNGVAVSFSK